MNSFTYDFQTVRVSYIAKLCVYGKTVHVIGMSLILVEFSHVAPDECDTTGLRPSRDFTENFSDSGGADMCVLRSAL